MSCEAAQLVQLGWDQELTLLAERPIAEPGPGQVEVAVEACGVCHRDLIDRDGRIPFMQLPVVPGHEAAGRVVAVGEGVTRWAVGDRVASMHRDSCGECPRCQAGQTSHCGSAAWVFGLLMDGGYARSLCAPEAAFYRVSEDLSAAEAAVLHCTFGTAWRGLVSVGGLQAGERVLITGANGGVGSAAVQIASRLGAQVTAIVRSEGHEEFLRGLGAAEVQVCGDGRIHKLPGLGQLDLALDCVGAPTFNGALRSLRVGGRIAVVGNITEERTPLNLGYLVVNALRMLAAGGATPDDMAAVLAAHSRAPFQIPIAAELPLAEADAAQRRLKAGGVQGRLVLRPEPSTDG